MTQNSFETPKEMRELAAKNIAQTQAAFQQFTDAMSQAMGMWSKAIPANQMTSRFTVVQDRAARFANRIRKLSLRWPATSPKRGTLRRCCRLRAAQGAAKSMNPKA